MISVTPAMDGIAVLAQLARNGGLGHLVRADRPRTARCAPGAHTAQPAPRSDGRRAGLERDHRQTRRAAGLHRRRGPSWRNEVCARAALEVAFNRPIRFASRVTCPLLVQAGTDDSIAPPARARRAAASGRRVELREYPIDHLDVYAGPRSRHLLADQLDFLRRHLSPTASRRTATTADWSQP